MRTSITRYIILPLCALIASGGFAAAEPESKLPRPEDPVVLPTDEEVARKTRSIRESSLRLLEHDADGWDDLWVLLQKAHNREYRFDPNNQGNDTDGDGMSDYEEMLVHRSATFKEPVYTKEEQVARIREQRRQAIENHAFVTEERLKRRAELAPLIIPPLTTEDGAPASVADVDAERRVKLASLAQKNAVEAAASTRRADAFARRYAIAKNTIGPDGQISSLVDVVDGVPQFNITNNVNAADSISTDEVRPGGALGLNLTGAGTTMAVWDGGDVLTSHQEFTTGGQRITDKDGVSPLGVVGHATHVSGIMMAKGASPTAQGMAYNASLHAYDWFDDLIDMPTAAGTDGIRISNHSYGPASGWGTVTFPGIGTFIAWYGDTTVSTTEDYRYGFYDVKTRNVDAIAYDAPNYLSVWAAGNERGSTGPTTQPVGHYANQGDANWIWYANTSRPLDGGATGFDTIAREGVAKNVLTVTAVEDLIGGWASSAGVTMASFSSFGGCDDGRIKPDISANGVLLTSPWNTGTNFYNSISGTSMATPTVAGSLNLLTEHFTNLSGSSATLRAASLKALAIHTADEAGAAAGPDYQFGWGLMNTESAAALLTAHAQSGAALRHLKQVVLQDDDYIEFEVRAIGGQPLRVTIVWTDPAGTVPPKAVDIDLDTTKALVNDLDLRLFAGATEHFSWKLNPANPSSAATRTGDNSRDNVEQALVDAPTAGQVFTVRVTHKGTLKDDTGATAAQGVSIVLDGIMADDAPDFRVYDISETGTDEYTVTWSSVVGATYRMESSTDLSDWTELTGDFVATKEFTSAEVSNATSEARRFWRVKRLP